MSGQKVPDIPGAEAVSAWFGGWPSFHDAELIQLQLNRSGISQLKVHAWRTSYQPSDVDAQGHFRTDKHAVVTFELAGITDLELRDFSSQNVLAALGVSRDGEIVRVHLSPSYGLGGRIDAREVKVSYLPAELSKG